MKKVILLLVDSLMPVTLGQCVSHRTVPALKFLQDRGRYWSDCVTVFPTMTASVDSSLLTGEYPDKHKVPGLVWYDPKTKKLINYINDWKCILKLGLADCIHNAIYDLNEKHLSKDVSTLFEELAIRNKSSASINAFVHRGTQRHRIKLPFLFNMILRSKSFTQPISGPEVLTFGSIVESEVTRRIPKKVKSLSNCGGINDTFAIQAAKSLIQSKSQPDFMLIYLPDNDHKVHKTNPAHAENSLIRVDEQIQELLNSFYSWDDALEKCVFIVVSDHGQTRIEQDQSFSVDLDLLLHNFKIMQPGDKENNHDLIIANNERMAYIYPLKTEKTQMIIKHLRTESRLDIVAWKDGNGVRAAEGGTGREIYYEPGGPFMDMYNTSWHITGEWDTLDLNLTEGIVCYGDYPDALSRLYGALYSQDIPSIVITARPRYELESKYCPTHKGGGSHGSLHKYDSLIPLIISDTEQYVIGDSPRLVDLKPFILNLL
jgi:predicted AlkP superfamily pyrophosphatase or phosphodiesterase